MHQLGLLEALQVAGDGAQAEGVKAERPPGMGRSFRSLHRLQFVYSTLLNHRT